MFVCKIPIIGSLLRPLIYPVDVEIYEKIGDAIVKKQDYGRRFKKDQMEKFNLFKENVSIEPPKYENYIITKAGKPLLMLFKATSGEYRTFTPITFETYDESGKRVSEGLKMTVTDKNVLSWMVQEYTRNWLRFHKPKWYEIYAPYIILAVSGVIMLVMIVTVSKELTAMSSALGGVASQINQAAKTFSDALSTVGTIQRPPIS